MDMKIIQYYKLSNAPDWVEYCSVSESDTGEVYLTSKSKSGGEQSGWFKTWRALKMYVTQNITREPSRFEKETI